MKRQVARTKTLRAAAGHVAAAALALVLAACTATRPAPVVDLTEGSSARAGSADRMPPGTYRVVSGDTLYAIAFRNGLDYRDVAAWNGIESPYRIYPGQQVRLTPPPPRPREAARQGPAQTTALAAGTARSTSKNQAVFEDVPPETRPSAAASPAARERAASAQAPASTTAAKTATTAAAPAAVARDSVATGAGGVNWRWPGKGALISTFVAGSQTRQGIDIAGKAGDPVLAAAAGEVVYSGNGLLGYGELIIVKHNADFLSAYGHNRKRLVEEGERVKAGQQIAEMGSTGAARDELHFEIRKNGKPVNPLDYLPAR